MADRTTWKSEGGRHWLAVAWKDGLQRVLEGMIGPEALAGTRFDMTAADQAAWQGWEAPAWWRLALPGIADAIVWMGGPRNAVEAVGRLIAGDSHLSAADCQETFLELVNQTAAAGSDAISEELGRRVQFSQAQIGESPGNEHFAVQIMLSVQGATQVLAVVMSAELLQDLGEPDTPSAAATAGAGVPAVAGPTAILASAPSGNLDLLLEVELPVCVTFGRTQLPLKDVLKLSSGSIVELNRLANEPVEVLINNSVIARGEVVVVDGNYGIRVTEIVSRQERIRSIL